MAQKSKHRPLKILFIITVICFVGAMICEVVLSLRYGAYNTDEGRVGLISLYTLLPFFIMLVVIAGYALFESIRALVRGKTTNPKVAFIFVLVLIAFIGGFSYFVVVPPLRALPHLRSRQEVTLTDFEVNRRRSNRSRYEHYTLEGQDASEETFTFAINRSTYRRLAEGDMHTIHIAYTPYAMVIQELTFER